VISAEDVCYRCAAPADAHALAAFAAHTFTDTFGPLYPSEDLAAFLAEKYSPVIQREEIDDPACRTWLAERADALIGYAMAGPIDMAVEHGANDRELYRLYVGAEAKGAGVAQALMARVLAWAREQGASALWLSVWENNARAQAFYRRYGFEHVGEHKFMVGKTADRDFIWRLQL
jgi:diamine N-acetyltransferase